MEAMYQGVSARLVSRWSRLYRQVKRRARRTNCLDCGYLIGEFWPDDVVGANVNAELRVPDRLDIASGALSWNMKARIFCARHLWITFPEDTFLERYQQVTKARSCGMFFPYSEGSAQDHRDSHRSRTNRRWLVAGALIGPYIATAAGFIASESSKTTSGQDPLTVAGWFGGGLIALIVVAFFINVAMHRT